MIINASATETLDSLIIYLTLDSTLRWIIHTETNILILRMSKEIVSEGYQTVKVNIVGM
jgi:hypothetical protein